MQNNDILSDSWIISCVMWFLAFCLRKGVENDSIDIVKEKSSKFMPCPSTGSKMFCAGIDQKLYCI